MKRTTKLLVTTWPSYSPQLPWHEMVLLPLDIRIHCHVFNIYNRKICLVNCFVFFFCPWEAVIVECYRPDVQTAPCNCGCCSFSCAYLTRICKPMSATVSLWNGAKGWVGPRTMVCRFALWHPIDGAQQIVCSSEDVPFTSPAFPSQTLIPYLGHAHVRPLHADRNRVEWM